MALEGSAVENSGASRYTQVAAGSPANTKNTTYTELIASSGAVTNWIRVSMLAPVQSEFLVDIAVGAVSSEVVLISNILFTSKSGNAACTFTIPVPEVASGARFSATCQSTGASDSVGVYVEITDDDSYGTAAAIETIGAATGDSGGVSIDPGGTANTLGSIVEIDASIAHDYDYLIAFIGNAGNSTMTNANTLVEILTGASSSEVLLARFAFNPSAQEVMVPSSIVISPYHTITSGTRLSARAQCTITDATDRLFDIVLIGVNTTAPAGGGGGMIVHPGMVGGMNG